MQCSSIFFSQAIPGVLQGYWSCCSSSPRHIKAVKDQMAEKYISDLCTAGSQGCAADWSPNTLHHCLAISQISLEYKQILKNLLC